MGAEVSTEQASDSDGRTNCRDGSIENRNRLGECGCTLALISLIGFVVAIPPLAMLAMLCFPATLLSLVASFRHPRGHAICGTIIGMLVSFIILDSILRYYREASSW